MSNFEGAIRVPYLDVGFSEPNRCFVQVLECVKDKGGSMVCGWYVEECPYYYILTHHGVWKMPTGELVTVSPQINARLDAPDGMVYVVGDDIWFVPDESVPYDGNPLSVFTRYVAKGNNPLVVEALEYLSRSDRAWYEQQDQGKCIYLTQRAERLLSKASGKRAVIPMPIGQR